MVSSKENPRISEVIDLTLQVMNKAIKSKVVAESVGYVGKKIIQGNIDAQGRPTRWQSLSPAYKRVRQEEGSGTTIGYRTGNMYNRMTYTPTPGAVSIFSKAKYSKYFDRRYRLYVIPKSELPKIADAIMKAM